MQRSITFRYQQPTNRNWWRKLSVCFNHLKNIPYSWAPAMPLFQQLFLLMTEIYPQVCPQWSRSFMMLGLSVSSRSLPKRITSSRPLTAQQPPLKMLKYQHSRRKLSLGVLWWIGCFINSICFCLWRYKESNAIWEERSWCFFDVATLSQRQMPVQVVGSKQNGLSKHPQSSKEIFKCTLLKRVLRACIQ